MAVFGFSCSLERMGVALCLPSIANQPFYIFSRYPLEKTKLWNLINLLTPTSWFWTFLSILLTVVILKLSTLVGTYFGLPTTQQEITLVPIRSVTILKVKDIYSLKGRSSRKANICLPVCLLPLLLELINI